MNFGSVKRMAIKEGRVRRVRVGNRVLFEETPKTRDLIPEMTNTWWISTSGAISNTTDRNWRSTDKIPVSKGDSVTFVLAGYKTVGSVVAYNASGKVIDYVSYPGDTTLFEGVYAVPDGATHITVTGHAPTNTLGPQQSVVLTWFEKKPPRYHTDGLIMWCDGIDNMGEDADHSLSTTTWKDLTGNGNDLINTDAKDKTTPASSEKGKWEAEGAYINAQNNQFWRTVRAFDLGADRSIEVRFTLKADIYATFGFATGDRYKYRITANGVPVNDWFRTSASDTSNIVTVYTNKSATVGVPATMCITRHYDAETGKTEYKSYLNGVRTATNSQTGNHRAGETSYVLLGNERDDATFHSVRMYNRALSEQEVADNYEYDVLRFAGVQSYITRGLKLWCDGINNTGNGHSASVTTWKDLTGNGHDLINVSSKEATTPAATVQGVWTGNGITLDNAASQFVRSVEAFDLSNDRTLELRLSAASDGYAELGFVHADRYKYRTSKATGWYLISKEDAIGYIITPQRIPPTPVGEAFTVTITRHYNAATDKTVYDVYYNGKFISTTPVAGDYMKGQNSILLFDDEKGHMTLHSVRLYSRALTAGEIVRNYCYDTAHFAQEV
jgi:hypothetical protein